MIVSRSCTMHPQSPTLTIGGTVLLKESDGVVILGVTFDSKMSFEKLLCSVFRAAMSGRLTSILLFFIFLWWHDLLHCSQLKTLSRKSCYSIGLLSCESIAKPYLDHVATLYGSGCVLRHFIGSGTSLSLLCWSGGGKFITPPIVPYIAGSCSMRARTISPAIQLTCCWLLTIEPSELALYWRTLW